MNPMQTDCPLRIFMLSHLVLLLDRAAAEIRQQHDTDITPNKGEQP